MTAVHERAEAPRVLVRRADWDEPSWRAQAARERLRVLAREALRELAARLGAPEPALAKDADGAPAATAGWHWSLSHSGGVVAAALSTTGPVGVDVEPSDRVPSDAVRARLAELGARAVGARGWLAQWCRVEAALKATGRGLGGLSRVRVEGTAVAIDGRAVPTRVFELGGAVLAAAGPGADRMATPVLAEVPA